MESYPSGEPELKSWLIGNLHGHCDNGQKYAHEVSNWLQPRRQFLGITSCVIQSSVDELHGSSGIAGVAPMKGAISEARDLRVRKIV